MATRGSSQIGDYLSSTPTCFLCGVDTLLVLLSIQGRRDYLKQVTVFKTYLPGNGDEPGVETCANCVKAVNAVWELTQRIEAYHKEIAAIVDEFRAKRGKRQTVKRKRVEEQEKDGDSELEESEFDGTLVKEEVITDTEVEDLNQYLLEELITIEPEQVKENPDEEGVPESVSCFEVLNSKPQDLDSDQSLQSGRRQLRKRKVERDHLAINYKGWSEGSSEAEESTDSELDSKSSSHKNVHNCEFCDKTYSKRAGLAQHIRLIHTQGPFVCSLCTKKLSTRRTWAVHEALVCKVPDKNWSPERLKTEFNITIANCPEEGCQKQFDSRRAGDLKVHIASHTQTSSGSGRKRKTARAHDVRGQSNAESVPALKKKYKYICPHCKKELCDRRGLSDHVRFVHLQERPHKCSRCPKSFTKKYSLSCHVKWVHTKETFSCSKCAKELKTRRMWAFHEVAICRVEGWSEERLKMENLTLVKCPVEGCGKMFDQTRPSHVTRHLISHEKSSANSGQALA